MSVRNQLLLLAAATVLGGAALHAGEHAGHRHKYTGDGDLVDFAIESEGNTATLYLAKKPTNTPVTGEKVLFVPDDESEEPIHFKETPQQGVYVTFVKGGEFPEGSLKVTVDGETDEVEAYLAEDSAGGEAGHEGHDHSHGHSHSHDLPGEAKATPGGTVALAVAGMAGFLLLGMILGRSLARRPRLDAHPVTKEAHAVETAAEQIQKSSMLVLALASLALGGTDVARADEGHTHGEVEMMKPGAAGEVEISKKSQFLLGLTTVEAEKSKQGEVLETFGHVVPKPQLDAIVKAPTAGYVRGTASKLWGTRVKKGESLGHIEAVGAVNLVAPVSGVLVEALAVEGQRVEPGEKLFRVVDTSTVWVDAEVFQKDLPALKGATTAVLSLEGAAQNLPARVVGARTGIDENTLAAKVFVELDNPGDQVPLGALGHVTFDVPGGTTDGYVLPKGAVLNRGGERIVFVQTGPEKFRAKPVATKYGSRPGEVIVTSGLDDGDRVVVTGSYQLLVGAH